MLSRNRLRFVKIALAVAFGLAAGATYAQSTKTALNVATFTAYPPFEFKDPTSNELVGFDIDLVNALAAKMGTKVNWIESKWEQLVPSIETKRADAIVGIADSPERRDNMSFLDYAYDNSVFFVLRASATQYPSMESVCGKRVAVTRSSIPWLSAIDAWNGEHCTKAGRPAVIVAGSNGTPDTRMQLDQGRVDVGVHSIGVMTYQNKLQGDRYVAIGKPFLSVPLGVAFAKDNPELGLALKKALSALIADGTYRDLLHKWSLTDDSAIEQPMINGQP